MGTRNFMLSVVIPAYDEEGAIGETVEHVARVLREAGISDHEILVVDDGSKDATESIAATAGATVIKHPHNVGYGRSLKDGIRAAKYDTICIIDADLTYPVQAIPTLLAEYKKGHDLVVGARTGHHYEGTMFKGPLRSILRFIVEFSAAREIPDANSGLRIFSKTAVMRHLDHLCDTFSFTTSQTLAYAMTGRFIAFIPIEYHDRVGTTKVRLLKDSARTMQYIIQSINYYNPLKIFMLLSMLGLLVSFSCFVVALLTGLTTPYYLGVGGLLLTVVIFSLGLLADLLRQIMVRQS
jgi:glycosyltransferase involved in cell wall biosynthesis